LNGASVREALVLLEDLIPDAEPDNRPALWHKAGDAHMALGEFDKAISAYKRDSRERAGADAVAWMGRAHSLLQQQSLATREFKRAIRLSEADELAAHLILRQGLAGQLLSPQLVGAIGKYASRALLLQRRRPGNFSGIL
jgi:tetratricopeptide (TPR) repeat protein